MHWDLGSGKKKDVFSHHNISIIKTCILYESKFQLALRYTYIVATKQIRKKRLPKISRRRLGAIMVAFALLASTSMLAVNTIKNRLQSRASTNLSAVTQQADCTVNTLPDRDCTPGAIWKGASKSQLCLPGYSSLVRNVPAKTINDIFSRYKINQSDRSKYEIDHLVSLQLGGSNATSNLWPLNIKTKDKKDRVENYLKRQICDNKISIKSAQSSIAKNWVELHKRLPDPK